MDQFKHVFNAPSLYDTLFFDVITQTNYSSIDEFKEHDMDLYLHWASMAEKKYGSFDNITYTRTAQFLPEFSQIVAIPFGWFKIENGEIKSYYRIITGDEIDIIDKFFVVLNSFREKKLDGFLCGHNITGHHIPTLVKKGIKYNFKIPKSIKNNLIAKPWENSIIDTVDLWKFNGNEYTSLDVIVKFLGIDIVYYDSSRLSENLWNNTYDVKSISKIRYEHLIKLYSKLRDM